MAVLGKSTRFGAAVLATQLVIGCGSSTTDSAAKDGSVNRELPPEAPKNGSSHEQIRYMRGDIDTQPRRRTEGRKAADAPVIDPSAK